jgi:hypothetical protein
MKDEQLYLFVGERSDGRTSMTAIKTQAIIKARNESFKRVVSSIFQDQWVNVEGLKPEGVVRCLRDKRPSIFYNQQIVGNILDELVADKILLVVDEEGEKVFFSNHRSQRPTTL